MVSVRDVTSLREMQKNIDAQNREMKIISIILPRGINNFEDFYQKSKGFIKDCFSNNNANNIKGLFINLHTMKGTAKQFQYQDIAIAVHDIEQYYDDVRSGVKKFDSTLSRQMLSQLEGLIDEYKNILLKYVGASASNYEFKTFSEKLKKELKPYLQEKDYNIVEKTITTVYQNLNNENVTLSDILQPLISSVPNLCKELSKEEVKVIVEGASIEVSADKVELVSNIMSHILKNSLDHGIEDKKTRLKKQKNIVGKIFINSILNHEEITITVSDDGQGLNLKHLKEVAMEKNGFSRQVSDQEIANIIFQSGISTVKKVTDISGRGVGMDAVKTFLEKNQGSINIEFIGDKNKDGFRPFKFIITIPNAS